MPRTKRLFLTEAEVDELLDMGLALKALEEVFEARSAGEVYNQSRYRLPTGSGSYNFMSASWPKRGFAGHKSYVGGPGGVNFHVMLYGTNGEGLIALLEAGRMGQVRTGAASGVATNYMARQNASTVGIIGSGYQAETQLEAVCAVRDITDVKVFSRQRVNREKFAANMADRLGTKVVAVESKENAAEGVDVLIAVTNSVEPVVTGEMLEPGIHVNAAGNNSWTKRELDTHAIRKADLIVCDDIEQAKIECGELMQAAETGEFVWDSTVRLDAIVAGLKTARFSDSDITLFESQGVAFEDLAVCARLYELALEQGIGTRLPD